MENVKKVLIMCKTERKDGLDQPKHWSSMTLLLFLKICTSLVCQVLTFEIDDWVCFCMFKGSYKHRYIDLT
jgi:hypothetical protein